MDLVFGEMSEYIKYRIQPFCFRKKLEPNVVRYVFKTVCPIREGLERKLTVNPHRNISSILSKELLHLHKVLENDVEAESVFLSFRLGNIMATLCPHWSRVPIVDDRSRCVHPFPSRSKRSQHVASGTVEIVPNVLVSTHTGIVQSRERERSAIQDVDPSLNPLNQF